MLSIWVFLQPTLAVPAGQTVECSYFGASFFETRCSVHLLTQRCPPPYELTVPAFYSFLHGVVGSTWSRSLKRTAARLMWQQEQNSFPALHAWTWRLSAQMDNRRELPLPSLFAASASFLSLDHKGRNAGQSTPVSHSFLVEATNGNEADYTSKIDNFMLPN